MVVKKENLGININIYISHSLGEFEYFRIKDLAEYLESKDEIGKVFYIEQQLVGDIDTAIRNSISKSHLILFFATRNSVFQSKYCLQELKIGFIHGVPIIPIKGEDVTWEHLESVEMARELGFEFYHDDFDRFLDNLYQYIQKIWQTIIPKTKIYLNHSVREFEQFQIKEIANFLEQFNEIHQVIYLERDLIGNVDEYINEIVTDLSIMLCFCSSRFLDCKDCIHELNLAKQFNIENVSVKSADVNWEDLVKVGLSQEQGFEFDADNFNKLCVNISELIKEMIQYKVDNKEFLEKERFANELNKKFKEILKSSKFNEFFIKNKEKIRNLLYSKEKTDIILYNILAEFLGKNLTSEEHEAQCNAFISYATADSNYFKIKTISEGLEKYIDIREAFFWEEDMDENAIVYMSDYIKRSEILILFCSPNAYKSWLVEMEWSAAVQLRKAVIPVFVNIKCIPPILSPMLGVHIKDIEDTEKITEDIHSLVVKRMREKRAKEKNN